MPRTYNKKAGKDGARAYKTKYSDEQLEKAMQAMKPGMNASEASRKYGIPKSTLYDKKSGNCFAFDFRCFLLPSFVFQVLQKLGILFYIVVKSF